MCSPESSAAIVRHALAGKARIKRGSASEEIDGTSDASGAPTHHIFLCVATSSSTHASKRQSMNARTCAHIHECHDL
jgi:hypothetical protein